MGEQSQYSAITCRKERYNFLASRLYLGLHQKNDEHVQVNVRLDPSIRRHDPDASVFYGTDSEGDEEFDEETDERLQVC